MARPKEFDDEAAIDAAIAIFREHGFEGTSAQMLVDAMGIGRQSLYNTFGDKWGIYRAAVQRYARCEGSAHHQAVTSEARAIDGIRAMLLRVAGDAERGCLGVNSVVEFGVTRPELVEIRAAASATLLKLFADTVRRGQEEGDIASSLDPEEVASFLVAQCSGLRIAARGGTSGPRLAALIQLALRALR